MPVFPRFMCHCALPLLSATALLCYAAAATAQDSPPLNNAAASKSGATIRVKAGTGAKVDSKTSPAMLADGNVHTRQVFTEAPYTITITLMEKMRVEKLAFAHSDYAKELAPQNLEIRLDGGPATSMELELQRPGKKREPSWQELPIGKDVEVIEITVLSNHQPDESVNWGGLGEVAVLTPLNLQQRLEITGHDENAPTFVHAPAIASVDAPPVKMPPRAAAGEYPRLLFTPDEFAEFKATLEETERGRKTLESFLRIANGHLAREVVFPSIEETVANKVDKQHNDLSHRVQAFGLAYALTGEDKYAAAAEEILLGYAERYEGYPRHSGRNKADSSKVMFQRLSEAMWLIPQLIGLDYIYTSAPLSDADKTKIVEGLIHPAILEIRRKETAAEVAERDRKSPAWREQSPEPLERGKYPNWLNFYSTATMMAGALLDNRDMLDLAAADFRTAIATGIGADGMWGEGAIGYQLFAMGVMVPGFEAAARQGIDLWNEQGGRFKQLFDSPLRYAYPDGTMPGINDSGRARLGTWQSMVYDYGYLRYQDPAYTLVINSSPRQLHTSEGVYLPTRYYAPLPEPASLESGSIIFGSLGYSILRDAEKYALMDYGPHGGVHGHYDKLNLLLFGNVLGGKGDELGGEPKFVGYDSPLHNEWTIQTVAHNSMSVDERSQAACEGKLLVYEDTPELKVLRAETTGVYPGVLLDRTVVVTGDMVLDLYTGRSAMPRTWDRTFLFSGALAGNEPGGEPLGSGAGYQHIRVGKRTEAAQGWHGTWNTTPGEFSVYLAGASGQEVLMGTGPEDVQLALARQKGERGQFAAAYQLKGWGAPIQTISWLPAAEGVQACEVTQPGGKLLVLVSDGQAWEAAGWKSDARVLVVSTTGEDTRVLVGGGSFAEGPSGKVRLDGGGNGLAQGTPGDLKVVSFWKP